VNSDGSGRLDSSQFKNSDADPDPHHSDKKDHVRKRKLVKSWSNFKLIVTSS